MTNINNSLPNYIAIWGSYLWGNFGDDVMAISISKFLKEKGFIPIVYKLDPALAKKYDIDTESDISHLFEKANAIVIGGGGLLCTSKLMEAEFEKLYFMMSKYKLPLHICSIGGDGGDNLPLLDLYFTRTLMLPEIKSATVRLKTDLRIFNELKVPCEYFPDIVLSTPRFFPLKENTRNSVSKSKRKLIQVLLNLDKNRYKERYAKVLDWADWFRGLNVKYIRTHLSWLNPKSPPFLDYEFLPIIKKEKAVVYESVEQVRDVILNTDIVISNKLHLGVFALAYGTPFLSVNGAQKTKSFLKEAGLDSNIVHMKTGFSIRMVSTILRKKKLFQAIKSTNDNKRLKSMAKESFGHYRALSSFLDTYAS